MNIRAAILRHSLEIIIPCYNPAPNWFPRFVERISHVRSELQDVDLRFIFVDDGSTENLLDTQLSELSSCNDVTVIRLAHNHGKGAAIRAGLAQAKADFIIFTDCDFPYTSQSVASVYSGLVDGADIVFGVRSPDYYSDLPWQRVVLSRSLRFFNRTLFRLKFDDTQCGLKGFSPRGKAVLASTQTAGYLIDIECLLLATALPELQISSQAVSARKNQLPSSMTCQTIWKEMKSLSRILVGQLWIRNNTHRMSRAKVLGGRSL